MQVQTFAVTIATGATPGAGQVDMLNATGRVLAIRYVKDGSNGYSNDSTFTLTNEATVLTFGRILGQRLGHRLPPAADAQHGRGGRHL